MDVFPITPARHEPVYQLNPESHPRMTTNLVSARRLALGPNQPIQPAHEVCKGKQSQWIYSDVLSSVLLLVRVWFGKERYEISDEIYPRQLNTHEQGISQYATLCYAMLRYAPTERIYLVEMRPILHLNQRFEAEIKSFQHTHSLSFSPSLILVSWTSCHEPTL